MLILLIKVLYNFCKIVYLGYTTVNCEPNVNLMTGAAGDSSNHPLMKSFMLSGEHHCGISDWCDWLFL